MTYENYYSHLFNFPDRPIDDVIAHFGLTEISDLTTWIARIEHESWTQLDYKSPPADWATKHCHTLLFDLLENLKRTHELKALPIFFQHIWNGTRTFEVRKNDRDYRIGDTLYLREWSPETGYTNRRAWGVVSCMTTYGQPEGQVVMAFSPTITVGATGRSLSAPLP